MRPATTQPDDQTFVILGAIMRRLEGHTAHIMLNTHGIVEVWNPPATALFGWLASEAVGQPLATLVVPLALRPSHQAGLARWHATQTTTIACKRLRTVGQHKNGTLLAVYVDVQIVRDVSSHEVHFLGWVTEAEDTYDGRP